MEIAHLRRLAGLDEAEIRYHRDDETRQWADEIEAIRNEVLDIQRRLAGFDLAPSVASDLDQHLGAVARQLRQYVDHAARYLRR